VVGPLHERTLCLLLLLLQVVCCLGTMFLRFYLANMFT
jgi:hypothetical protein